jgi:DNA-binding NarL/FixJ family response regulator
MLQTRNQSQTLSTSVSHVGTNAREHQDNKAGEAFLHALGFKPLFDSLAHGILIVDAQRQMHYANAVAQQNTKLGRCLILQNNALQAMYKPDQLAFEASIQKATQHNTNGQSNAVRSVLRLRVVDTKPPTDMLLLVTPLHGTQGHPALNSCYANHSNLSDKYLGLAAIQLQKSNLIDPAMLCLFARSYKLTNAEEMVLSLLCDGLDAPEVATTLNVAVSTIRTHVRALCEKMQANSIRQLILKVALVPGVAGVSGLV